MRLVDSHCHVQADRFAVDLDTVIADARRSGVERILVPGWDVRSSERALDVLERHPWLDAGVGIHPHDSAAADERGWARIVELAADPRVVAIGETGLDFDRNFSPPGAQLANLRRHLELALATGKPAILHCRSATGRRDAQDALLAEVRRVGFGGSSSSSVFGDRPPAVVHSFSGPIDYGLEMLAVGCAVSFSGLVFRAGEEGSAALVAHVPTGRLLVETDSPFLTPPGAARRRNEPAHVAITAGWVAEHLAVDPVRLGDALVAAYDATFRAVGRTVAPRTGAHG